MVIKFSHTDNVIFNDSESMEELLKKYQNIRFSGNVASNKNDSTERTIKMVVNMESTMLMQAVLICPKDTLFT